MRTSTNIVIIMNEEGPRPVVTAWSYTATIVSGYVFATFTDNTNFAHVPIKFAVPPFTNFNYSVTNSITNATVLNDGFDTTAPVGSFPDGKTPFGAEDMVGNVWEWTSDFWGPYGTEPLVDPKGPEKSEDGRVVRGGAWNGAFPSWVRPTFRFHMDPSTKSHGVGFRCAKNL